MKSETSMMHRVTNGKWIVETSDADTNSEIDIRHPDRGSLYYADSIEELIYLRDALTRYIELSGADQ